MSADVSSSPRRGPFKRAASLGARVLRLHKRAPSAPPGSQSQRAERADHELSRVTSASEAPRPAAARLDPQGRASAALPVRGTAHAAAAAADDGDRRGRGGRRASATPVFSAPLSSSPPTSPGLTGVLAASTPSGLPSAAPTTPKARPSSLPLLSSPPSSPPPVPPSPSPMAELVIPETLRMGTPMTKVSAKRQKRLVLRFDPDQSQLLYETKKLRIIPVQSIRELRTRADGRYDREALQISASMEPRWLSLIYTTPATSKSPGTYKALHLIAPTSDVLMRWETTLLQQAALRKSLLHGEGGAALREQVWARQHWAAADGANASPGWRRWATDTPSPGLSSSPSAGTPDGKLEFDEVEAMCRRLNVNSGRDDLRRLFQEAAAPGETALDFAAFQRFVRLLKVRPELDALYARVVGGHALDYAAFAAFVRTQQKVTWDDAEVERVFRKFASDASAASPVPALDNATGHVGPELVPKGTGQDKSLAGAVAEVGMAASSVSEPSSTPRQVQSATAPSSTPTAAPVAGAPLPTTLAVDAKSAAPAPTSGPLAPPMHQESAPGIEVTPPSAVSPPPGMPFTNSKLSDASLAGIDLPGAALSGSPGSSPSLPAPRAAPSAASSQNATPRPGSPCTPRASSPQPAPALAPLATLAFTRADFTSFLMSIDNAASTSAHRVMTDDMTRPLSEYFISSSHNTYLVGHQLVGDSTIEGYIRALLHGCRSVELDIYDGDIEPVVYHGKTLTSRVPVRDIARAIARYAFLASPFPLILSVELHCGLPQQVLLSKILNEEFGDALVSAPVAGRPQITQLPSPDALRGRVMIKTKNVYVVEQEGSGEKQLSVDTESSATDTGSASDNERVSVGQELKNEVKELKHEFQKARNILNRVRGKSPKPVARSPPAGSAALSSSPGTGGIAGPGAGDERKKTKAKMAEEVVELLVYTVGVKCRGLNKKEVYAPEHMFSLSEKTADKFMHQGPLELIKHNRTHLVRIYPKGMRFDSSNYHPHRFWAVGAQLVALNWQTFDLGTLINRAMFQRNGRIGYVLKPRALRESNKELLSKHTRHYLDVRVISAQQLPRRKNKLGLETGTRSVVDPYVEVSLHIPDWTHSPFHTTPVGTPGGGAQYAPPSSAATPGPSTARSVTARTAVVKNNGFNPAWDERFALPFDVVGDMLDLVFVRFAVKNESDGDDDEPLALWCASLASLQQGYRHLPLHDAHMSQYLFSTLFVQFSVREV